MGNAYCPGYMPIYDGFQSSTGEPENKSCRNCLNFENEICTIDYYDKVVAGLDQG